MSAVYIQASMFVGVRKICQCNWECTILIIRQLFTVHSIYLLLELKSVPTTSEFSSVCCARTCGACGRAKPRAEYDSFYYSSAFGDIGYEAVWLLQRLHENGPPVVSNSFDLLSRYDSAVLALC